MNHVIFFSSGVASFVAALRVLKKYGTSNLFLVFADTKMEDQDNYRFLNESANYIGGKLIHLIDGRNPWDVFNESKWLSHRGAKCSFELKIKPCREWIKNQGFDPKNTILYFGINFEEIERLENIKNNWAPFKVEAPLCWKSWMDYPEIMRACAETGIKRPRLYDLGFAHANCGGFCIKAGKKHFRNLLEKMPERYLWHEQKEQDFLKANKYQNIGILRKTVNGKTKGMSLKEWRNEIRSDKQLNLFEAMGGCGCFVDEDDF